MIHLRSTRLCGPRGWFKLESPDLHKCRIKDWEADTHCSNICILSFIKVILPPPPPGNPRRTIPRWRPTSLSPVAFSFFFRYTRRPSWLVTETNKPSGCLVSTLHLDSILLVKSEVVWIFLCTGALAVAFCLRARCIWTFIRAFSSAVGEDGGVISKSPNGSLVWTSLLFFFFNSLSWFFFSSFCFKSDLRALFGCGPARKETILTCMLVSLQFKYYTTVALNQISLAKYGISSINNILVAICLENSPNQWVLLKELQYMQAIWKKMAGILFMNIIKLYANIWCHLFSHMFLFLFLNRSILYVKNYQFSAFNGVYETLIYEVNLKSKV